MRAGREREGGWEGGKSRPSVISVRNECCGGELERDKIIRVAGSGLCVQKFVG